MPAYYENKRLKAYKGDYEPTDVSLGDKNLTGYKIETSNEKNFSFENSYNSGITGNLEGNSYQESNEASKNLFNKDDYQYLASWPVSSWGTFYDRTNIYDHTFYIKCKPNTTYTVSKMIAQENNCFSVVSCVDEPALSSEFTSLIGASDLETTTNLTITTGAEDNYLAVWCDYLSEATTLEEMVNSIQIEEGLTATDYEPFYYASPSPDSPSEILSVAESGELVLNNFGKNLFNGELSKGYFTDDEFTLSNTTSELYRSIMLYLIAGTYTVSWDTNVQGVRQIKDGIYSSSSQGVVDTNVYTFEVETNNLFGFSFRAYNGEDWDNSPIQIEKGSTATSYTPYVDPITTTLEIEPLRKVGDYADELSFDCNTVTVTRNTKKSIVTDDTLIDKVTSYDYFGINIPGVPIGNSKPFYCNLFLKSIPSPKVYIGNNEYLWVFYGENDFIKFANMTAAEFKQWLIDNNFYIIYPLVEPVTETYTIDEFRSRFDYNNISVEDGLLEVVEFNYKVFDK